VRIRRRKPVDHRLESDDAGYVPVIERRLTADDAAFPRAVEVLQRGPEPVIVYEPATLRSDTRAGRRDRPIAQALIASPAHSHGNGRQRLHTHFLQMLQDCCNHQAERERLVSCALIAATDDRLTAAYRSRLQTTAEIADIEAELKRAARSDFDGAALATAEQQFDTTNHRLGRRRREHEATIGELQRRLDSAKAALRQLEADIDALLASRTSHWSALLVRVTFLQQYYNRRANTYLRALVRGLRQPHDPVEPTAIPPPAWAAPAHIPEAPRAPTSGDPSPSQNTMCRAYRHLTPREDSDDCS